MRFPPLLALPLLVACTTPAAGPYRALGTEPFWAATVADGALILETPDAPPRRFAVASTPQGWAGEGVRLDIRPGPCSDGMSDTRYADKAVLLVGEHRFEGCGGKRTGGEGA